MPRKSAVQRCRAGSAAAGVSASASVAGGGVGVGAPAGAAHPCDRVTRPLLFLESKSDRLRG